VEVRLRLLGDVRVVVDGVPLPIKHHQVRGVLATLLVDVNTAVPLDALADRMWGDRPPRLPREALYSYLSRLRGALAPVEGVAIARRSRGYVLEADADTVDLHRFRALVKRADGAADTAARAALLTDALGLWTGSAFAGLDTPWLTTTRDVLAGEHLAAQLDLNDARLGLGQHDDLVAALSALADQRPLDERLAGQLVLALVRGGRQHEALLRYEGLRVALADELGVDPGPALRELHQRVLTADPALLAPVRASAPPVPRQLPAAPRLFTGRSRELTELVAARAKTGATVVVTAIGGTGGIGKTWLALHWSHQWLDQFPDGQLFVNLRGFDPSARPMPPEIALQGFLEAFGVAPSAVPAGLDARAALYRSLVAGKRLLVVLDNARDADQVVPLLPGTATATVLVTSRDRLTGLVGAHGAHSVALDVLSDEAARELLARRLGADRLAAEPAAARDLLTGCAGLPVALSIVAARAAAHPDFPLAVWAGELRDEANRVDALDDGAPSASLAAVLSWSVAALDPEHARAFGLLGLAPGPDVSAPAVAALCGLAPSRVESVLRALERVSLLGQHTAGRYRMHDLVRLYACTRLIPAEEDRRAALRRLVDFHLHTAATADRLLEPYRRPLDPAPAVPDHPHPIADITAAMSWFGAEHVCLAAAQQTAVDHGWDTATWQFAWVLNTFHHRKGGAHDLLAAWRHGVEAADRGGSLQVRAVARRYLGDACRVAGRLVEAAEHLHRALAMVEEAGDKAGQALIHRGISQVDEQLKDFTSALAHGYEALDIIQGLDNPMWLGDAHNTVGWYHATLEQYPEALEHCEIALAHSRLHGDPDGEGNALDSIGYILHRCGRYDEGLDHYRRSLALWQELGNATEEADTHNCMAELHADAGRPDEARAAWERALRLYVAQHRDADADGVRDHLAAL
jgi:DNA-binding SARP family transcriptional activator/tetratricopeptide (TPR) repeat protein